VKDYPMTVGDLRLALEKFDDAQPVHLMWSHGAEPGQVTKVVESCHHPDHRVLIHGEIDQ
jgi:hypothetical protein